MSVQTDIFIMCIRIHLMSGKRRLGNAVFVWLRCAEHKRELNTNLYNLILFVMIMGTKRLYKKDDNMIIIAYISNEKRIIKITLVVLFLLLKFATS